MSLVKFRKQPSNHFPSIWDDFFKRDLFDSSNALVAGSTLPAVNIKEDNDTYHIELAAPGFDKKDFEINLDRHVLTVSSNKEVSNETEEDGYSRKEFSYASFKRSFNLPDSADESKVSAEYSNGILNVHIPKKEEAKLQPARSIKVK